MKRRRVEAFAGEGGDSESEAEETTLRDVKEADLYSESDAEDGKGAADGDTEENGEGEIDPESVVIPKVQTSEADYTSSSLELPAEPFELQFHPSRQLSAVGLIDGSVVVLEYDLPQRDAKQAEQDRTSTVASPRILFTLSHHTLSCRSVHFSSDGGLLLTASKDATIAVVDVERKQLVTSLRSTHDQAFSCVRSYDASTLVAGDDEGRVTVWDCRTQSKKAALALNASVRWSAFENADYISDMYCLNAKKQVLATSGDSTLAVYDMRMSKSKEAKKAKARGAGAGEGPNLDAFDKLFAVSDKLEDDLLCITVLHGGSTIVCGSRDGALNLFTWDFFGQPDDRVTGHPRSVDTICALDEKRVVTGSSDGLIRVLSIKPNGLLGVLGAHGAMPVEAVRLSTDKQLVGSTGQDRCVRLWDVREDSDDEDEGEGEGEDDDSDDTDSEPASGAEGRAAAAVGGQKEEGTTADAQASEVDGKAAVEAKQPARKRAKIEKATAPDSDDSDDSDDDSDGGGSKRKKQKQKRKKPLSARQRFFSELD